jgi:hypothetical protein
VAHGSLRVDWPQKDAKIRKEVVEIGSSGSSLVS